MQQLGSIIRINHKYWYKTFTELMCSSCYSLIIIAEDHWGQASTAIDSSQISFASPCLANGYTAPVC